MVFDNTLAAKAVLQKKKKRVSLKHGKVYGLAFNSALLPFILEILSSSEHDHKQRQGGEAWMEM